MCCCPADRAPLRAVEATDADFECVECGVRYLASDESILVVETTWEMLQRLLI